MKDPKYYKELIDAAKRKNKSELEVYQCVAKCVDDLLCKENDEIAVIQSLIAYFEGRASRGQYTASMQIAYALLIGSASMLSSLALGIEDKIIVTALLFVILGMIIALFAGSNLDFEKKMIICVLNDKLEQYKKRESGFDNETVEKNISTAMVRDKKNKHKTKGNKEKK